MALNIDIRKALPTDSTGIAIVRAYTWMTAYKGLMPDSVLEGRINDTANNAGRIKGLIEKGKSDYAVALHNNAVVGFVSYGQSRNTDYDGGEINALYVLKGYSGKGIGKNLFEYAVTQLKADGHNSVIVNCLEGNPTVEFYKHMGGEIVGQRTDEIFGRTITENILMFEY